MVSIWTLRLVFISRLWPRVVFFHFFITFSFFLLIVTSSRSLEVVVIIRLRELQRVQGRTGWPPGLTSTQTFPSSPQGLRTGQAANRRLRRLSGKLQGELTSSWPGWWMVLVAERCPTKLLGSQLSGGAAVGAGPGKAEEQRKQQVSRNICGCFWIPKINVVISKCSTFRRQGWSPWGFQTWSLLSGRTIEAVLVFMKRIIVVAGVTVQWWADN